MTDTTPARTGREMLTKLPYYAQFMGDRFSDEFKELINELNEALAATDAPAPVVTTADIEHLIGNPVFAIETLIPSIRRRVRDGRNAEADELIDQIQPSIEKIKQAIHDIANAPAPVDPWVTRPSTGWTAETLPEIGRYFAYICGPNERPNIAKRVFVTGTSTCLDAIAYMYVDPPSVAGVSADAEGGG